MIGFLRGTLSEIQGSTVLVDVGGVGYEVSLPDAIMLQMPPLNEEVRLRVRQIFREDGVTLYGFLEAFQRRLFDLLLEVKGCGPKAALALIGQVGEDAVAAAIVAEDSRSLCRATGIGPRLADRIVLELKDKMREEQLLRTVGRAVSRRAEMPPDELVEALVNLGYRRHEADAAAAEARDAGESLEERIKLALRSLNR